MIVSGAHRCDAALGTEDDGDIAAVPRIATSVPARSEAEEKDSGLLGPSP